MTQKLKVIAHRGASAFAPENTIAALKKAAELGAEWVEFDVQLSCDNQVVIFHDEDLMRTTGVAGHVYDYPLKALTQLDAGSWFAPEFKGECIPSFREWLQVASALGLKLNIELKPALTAHHKALIENVLADLSLFWPHEHDSILISSFDHACLEAFYTMSKAYPIACLFHAWDENWQNTARAVNASVINLEQQLATPERVAQIHAEHYPIFVYTVNQRERANALLALGVEGVFSDNPTLLN